MGAVLYPVAANAEQALSAPLGRAAREREAEALAGTAVTFVTEPAGPAFADRDAALDAWKGRLDDDRPGRVSSVPPEDRYLELRELVAAEEKAQRPQKPLMKNGRRWPQPRPAPRVVWRLSISYWRLGDAPMAVAQQPRELRRRQKGAEATPDQLRRMAEYPLRAVKPQQPLDIGLFEARRPENPDLLIPDE